MNILLLSALGDHGYMPEHHPPKYYGFGALGDLFPKQVCYVNINDFVNNNDFGKVMGYELFDVIIIQQCKSPVNFHVQAMKKADDMTLSNDCKIILLQEDDITAVFRMPKQAQLDHFSAIRQYVDMLWIHEDERAYSVYSNTIDPHMIRYFHTPYPVKWASQFKIPFDDREFDWLVTGSISKEYSGILAVQHAIQSHKANHQTYLSTMQTRYNGHVEHNYFDGYLREQYWHLWLKQIANCKQFYKTSFEIGSRSMEIACGALGIEVLHANPYYPELMLPDIEMYDFKYQREMIRKELKELIDE